MVQDRGCAKDVAASVSIQTRLFLPMERESFTGKHGALYSSFERGFGMVGCSAFFLSGLQKIAVRS